MSTSKAAKTQHVVEKRLISGGKFGQNQTRTTARMRKHGAMRRTANGKRTHHRRIGRMVTTIIKRDGRTAEFKQEKIAEAVEKAFQALSLIHI